ncbi:hypothetical protein V8E53_001230 [Lactarius tabidus]
MVLRGNQVPLHPSAAAEGSREGFPPLLNVPNTRICDELALFAVVQCIASAQALGLPLLGPGALVMDRRWQIAAYIGIDLKTNCLVLLVLGHTCLLRRTMRSMLWQWSNGQLTLVPGHATNEEIGNAKMFKSSIVMDIQMRRNEPPIGNFLNDCSRMSYWSNLPIVAGVPLSAFATQTWDQLVTFMVYELCPKPRLREPLGNVLVSLKGKLPFSVDKTLAYSLTKYINNIVKFYKSYGGVNVLW